MMQAVSLLPFGNAGHLAATQFARPQHFALQSDTSCGAFSHKHIEQSSETMSPVAVEAAAIHSVTLGSFGPVSAPPLPADVLPDSPPLPAALLPAFPVPLSPPASPPSLGVLSSSSSPQATT